MIGRGHLRRKCRRKEGRSKGDEKLQPLRQAQEGGCCQPGIFATRSARRQDGAVAELIARHGDLGEVTDIRRAPVRGRAARQNVA